MENPTSQLVEEAVQAIKQGEISLETGGTRFGAAWPQIKGEVALILDLEKVGQAFKTNLPAPRLDKMWAQILPGLTPVEILPRSSNGNGAHHGQPIPSNILKITPPDTTENAVPAPKLAEPARTTAPIKLPTQKRKTAWEKWRKPLAWVAGIALIIVLSLSSLVGVANAAEPGDFFYDTKLWLDNARQYVAFSPEDKQNFALSYCDHRSQELEWLVKNNKLQYFSSVAGDYRQALQKAFPKDDSALTSVQANQLKAQQSRLSQLSSQLTKTNTNMAGQANAEVEKLVEQLDTYQAPGQNNPAPTATPGQTPTASPSPASTPSVSPTSDAIIGLTPPITTFALTVSPTVSITAPAVTVLVPPIDTPTSTPVADDDGSNGGLSYHDATPTPVASGNGNSGPQNGSIDKSNNSGPDNIPGNPSGNGSSNTNNSGNGSSSNNSGNSSGNSHHSSPTAVPAQPTHTPIPTPTPTSAPTATPTPAQTTAGPDNGNKGNGNGNNGNGNGNNGNGNNGNGSNPPTSPPAAKPANTPKPLMTPRS